jgi:hypothetical protein
MLGQAGAEEESDVDRILRQAVQLPGSPLQQGSARI